jgi:toxin ParE1/3/4
MRLPILWSDEALKDMISIFEVITESSPQNALVVDDRINEQVEMLSDFPLSGKLGRLSGTRELVIDKATSIVVYRVEDTRVRIVRVIHGGQLWSDEN